MGTDSARNRGSRAPGSRSHGRRDPQWIKRDSNEPVTLCRYPSFRLQSQASLGRDSHGRNQWEGCGQGYGPESWFSSPSLNCAMAWRQHGRGHRRRGDARRRVRNDLGDRLMAISEWQQVTEGLLRQGSSRQQELECRRGRWRRWATNAPTRVR